MILYCWGKSKSEVTFLEWGGICILWTLSKCQKGTDIFFKMQAKMLVHVQKSLTSTLANINMVEKSS